MGTTCRLLAAQYTYSTLPQEVLGQIRRGDRKGDDGRFFSRGYSGQVNRVRREGRRGRRELVHLGELPCSAVSDSGNPSDLRFNPAIPRRSFF